MNTHERVKDILALCDDDTLIALHNHYSQEICGSGDAIYHNAEEFFSIYFSDVLEAVRAVCFGEYRYQDEYVQFNGYGNLETTNNPEDWFDFGELATELLEDPDGELMSLLSDYDNNAHDEIIELLEEVEKEE